jgi:hypothetical protein
MNNISAVVAIRDNGGGGFFRYFDLFDEGEPTGGQIAAGQSFWVRATAPNPELVIHEGAKTIKGAIFFRTQSLAVSNFSISLSRDSLTDIAYYKIRPQAHAKLDNWDGLKLDNDHFDISFISNDNRSLAIQATSKFPCDTIIPIGLKDLKPGLYRLSVEAKRLFLRYNFTVLDKYTGTALILEPGEHVELRVTNDRESYAFDRISLRLIERELRRDVLLEGPPTVCVSQPFDLEVKGAEEGVRYSLSAGDREICSGVKVNASDALNFQISSDTLGLGQHVLRMKAMSGCHIIDLSSSYKLTVSESPKVFADSSITCMNEPAVLTAFCDQEEATFYWFEDESTRDTLARGNRFVTPLLRKSKTYFVSALTDGCTSDHHPVKAYIITYKPAMISMVTDTVLASNYSNNNLWYHQGEKVGGGRYLSITASGSYILEVDSLGCFSRDTLEIIVMNLETPVGKSLIVYPNPSNKDIYIEDLKEMVVKIEIVNDMGQLALQQEGRTDQRLYRLGLEMLSPGRYTLIVLTRFGKKIFRIVRSP